MNRNILKFYPIKWLDIYCNFQYNIPCFSLRYERYAKIKKNVYIISKYCNFNRFYLSWVISIKFGSFKRFKSNIKSIANFTSFEMYSNIGKISSRFLYKSNNFLISNFSKIIRWTIVINVSASSNKKIIFLKKFY